MERDEEAARPRTSDRLKGILTVEGIALGLGLALPVTPSRSGGAPWSPAELFTQDPSYLQSALASFFAVNLLFVLLGLVVWGVGRVRAGRTGS